MRAEGPGRPTGSPPARRRGPRLRAGALAGLALLAAAGCGGPAAKSPRVLVLGIDGLDPKLLQAFVEEGALPNFARLMAEGDFRPLQTTMPPLSPIAWSTFISGMDPGGHGVYDFVHREPDLVGEPKAMPLYMAMSRAEPPWLELKIGSYVLPLGGDVENLRRGPAFWQLLDKAGVPTTIFRMPANYPPVKSSGRALSGMGTPDMQGTAGTFSFYTDFPVANAGEITGGEIHYVEVRDQHVRARINGPENPLRREKRRAPSGEWSWVHPKLGADFDVYLDPDQPVAKLVVDDAEVVLREGEWSDWVPVRFDVVPLLSSLSGTGRFYLQQVRPDFKLYVTPIQIDVADPAQTITRPKRWARTLYEALGRFYTQELPEATKPFTYGIFSGEEFWDQAQFVYHEQRRALDYALERFDEGLLFFYFSSVDQGCHMLWRYADPEHPGFTEDQRLREGIRTLYEEMDEVLGRVRAAIDEDTALVVMSDHGFCPFYWQVNLNTWLLERGYVALKDPRKQEGQALWQNVDWSRTKAYAAGLNGLYVNLEGREKHGIVAPEDYDALLDAIESDLLAFRDPRNGQPVVTLVTRTRRDFRGPHLDVGPDVVVGYNRGYRSGWKSPTGEFPKAVIEDNTDPWSGDHAVDYRLVPGVLLTNRRITLDEPALYDLTVGVLDEYGVAKHPEMIGRDCLAPRERGGRAAGSREAAPRG